jgi:hypothetical protein
MSYVRTSVMFASFVLLSFMVFYDSVIFRHSALLVLVPLIPLVLVFVAAPAARTIWSETVALRKTFTWWQGLWLLLFLSALVFRMRAAQDIDQSPLDIWAIYRVGLMLIVGLILCARLLSDRTKWLSVLFSGTLGILVLYPLLAMVSTLWSVRPSWTFYKSVEYLVDLAAIAAVIGTVRSLQEYRKLVNWTWTLLGLLVATAWLGAIFDPADALLGGQTLGPLTVRLEGVMPSVDANSIGEICAILALVALNRMLNGPKAKQNRGWYAALFAVSLVTLFVSQTRAAMLAFVVGLALLLILLRRAWLVLAFGAVSGFAVLIALSFTDFGRTFSNFLLRGQSVQSVQGLSGRMDVWQASFDAFLQRPWTGYGGFAGSRFVVLPGIASQGSASSALSTYVDSMLDLGIWGPALLAVVVVAMVWFMFRATRGHYVRSTDRPLAVEMFVVFAVILVRSVVTSNVVGHPALAFLTVVGFIEVARRQFAAAQRMEIVRRAA